MNLALVKLVDGVATVTIARPERRNALNMALKQELGTAFQALAADPAVRCVVLTGAGSVFCAGGDIDEMELNDSPHRSRSRLSALLRDTIEPLLEMPKPVIAALNGDAHGAGLSLALACDVILADQEATLSCAFSRMALVPDCGALFLLPRRVGVPLAKNLAFSGRRLSATDARRIGLVDTVHASDELMPAANSLARDYARGPTVALGLTKQMLNRSLETSWAAMAELEAMAQAICYATDDHATARKAFRNRETPVFGGAGYA